MRKAEYEHAKGNGWIIQPKLKDSTIKKPIKPDSQKLPTNVLPVKDNGTSQEIQDSLDEHRGHILETGSQKAAAVSLGVQTALKGT